MRPEEHMAKARRLEVSRDKLDAEEDFELLVWSSLHAGAHLLNVVYHRQGFTAPEFDMIHTWVPELARPVPAQHAAFNDTLKAIESLGPRFVRGCEDWHRDFADKCLADYARLKLSAEEAMAEPSRSGRG